jgi:hypothetical protein
MGSWVESFLVERFISIAEDKYREMGRKTAMVRNPILIPREFCSSRKFLSTRDFPMWKTSELEVFPCFSVAKVI